MSKERVSLKKYNNTSANPHSDKFRCTKGINKEGKQHTCSTADNHYDEVA